MAKSEPDTVEAQKRPLGALKQALVEAQARKTLVWLLIDSPWSPEAQRWKTEVLADARVVCAKEDAVFCQINRDELPELDAAAQSLVQSLTLQGGWPLNIFLTPHGKPVFGVTSLELASLLDCLRQLLIQYELNPAGVEEHAQKSLELARSRDPLSINENVDVPSEEEQSKILSEAFYTSLLVPVVQSLDFETGLIGSAHAYHYPQVYRYLLDFTHRGQAAPFAVFEDDSSVEFNAPNWGEVAMARLARSSLCDVIGGGFFRSADRSVFPNVVSTEKLLVENAELFEVYALASKNTRSLFLTQVASETLKILNEGFYQSEIGTWASYLSHSIEYYSLASADLLEILPGPERQPAQMFFGIGTQPSVPRIVTELAPLSKQIGTAPADLKNMLAEVQKKLRVHRESLPSQDKPQAGAWTLHSEAVVVGCLLRGLMASDLDGGAAIAKVERSLDAWSRYEIYSEALAPREHWAIARALLAYVKWVRVNGGDDAAHARAAHALDTADLMMGLPENFPDNIVIDTIFLDLRLDYADHTGSSAGGLRLQAWQDRAELAEAQETQSESVLLQRIQTHLRSQLAHALGYAKKLGVHGASVYLALRRELRHLNKDSWLARDSSLQGKP